LTRELANLVCRT